MRFTDAEEESMRIVDKKVELCKDNIYAAGRTLTVAQWRDLLGELIAFCTVCDEKAETEVDQ